MRLSICVSIVVLAVSQPALAGMSFNGNFTVFSPAQPARVNSDAFRERIIAQADKYRKEIAVEWFGEELAVGEGKTTINFAYSPKHDKAFTWAKDRADRKYHVVYLTTSPEQAAGSTLKHEIVHCVLATRYPGKRRLPLWLEEGIASRYDDAERIQLRNEIVAHFGRSQPWPNVSQLVTTTNVPASDQHTYAFAASVTDYLLTRADRATLIRFGAACSTTSATSALQAEYGLSLERLQQGWQQWVVNQSSVASRR